MVVRLLLALLLALAPAAPAAAAAAQCRCTATTPDALPTLRTGDTLPSCCAEAPPAPAPPACPACPSDDRPAPADCPGGCGCGCVGPTDPGSAPAPEPATPSPEREVPPTGLRPVPAGPETLVAADPTPAVMPRGPDALGPPRAGRLRLVLDAVLRL